ncbi:MAG TPA: response regulator [Pirellulales bacterium]|nr:response regulator [Pirellulales bacterium]
MSANDALRVLVVDDHQDTIDSLAILLRCWGHEVHVAREGEAALKQALSVKPQLMLVDLAMPGMDGLQLARRLRIQPDFSKTPLIAVTGLSDQFHRRQAAEAGFDDFIVKPYSAAELLEVLARVQLSVAMATEAAVGLPAPAKSALLSETN